MTDLVVIINYTNYKGETKDRTISPIAIWFGTNDFHLEPQWILDAFDRDKKEERAFAMKDIHSWRPWKG